MVNTTSLYIHIPFCISKCKYCDFFSIPLGKNHNSQESYIPDSYIQALCNEIKFRIKNLNIKNLNTIYIGGGTPSLLNSNELEKIFSTIRKNTVIDENAEITIEANPDDISIKLLKSFERVGITRISLGIQSFCNESLKYVLRRADSEINKKALSIIKQNWNGELSVDLISGLPMENSDSFKEDVKYISSLKPDHISMYSLTIEQETPLGQELNNGILDYDFDFADDLWLQCKELLKFYGYNHYEVSNFSLDGKECRHNLKYWNHENYCGCGSGGAGSVYKENGECFRWTNVPNINKYVDFWLNVNDKSIISLKSVEHEENISVETSIFEFFMMGMRKLSGINNWDFEEKFNRPIPANIINVMVKWYKSGLCKITNTPKGINYSLGDKGILYLNQFLEEII